MNIDWQEVEYSGLNETEMRETIEFYLNLPQRPHPDCNPLNNTHICEPQQQDKKLLALQAKYTDNYISLQLDDNVNGIICYKKDPAQDNWKIDLLDSIVADTVKWFHQVLRHPGGKD